MSGVQVRSAGKVLRIGDTLDEALYGLADDNRSSVLLMAEGQRIETPHQLRRLQEAGFAVEMPRREDASSRSTTGASTSGGAHHDFSRRIQQAVETRKGLVGAVNKLMHRIRDGAVPDIGLLQAASDQLASGVASDPQAHAALAYLLRCNDYTVEHSADVAVLMVATGRVLGLPQSDLPLVSMAGLMHDVGKQRVPEHILNKPDRLTSGEYECVKKHPTQALEILGDWKDCPQAVRETAVRHHERLDGSGYPDGLAGDQIDTYSKLAAVADSFDAMTARRVYSVGVPPRLALKELYGHRETLFDSECVHALIKLIGVYPVGTRVLLASGDSGVVAAPNSTDTTQPTVLVDRDRRGRALDIPFLADWRQSTCRIVGTTAEAG
ncbi:MAG TPA: HD-GYP domain-containing protein [Armatimonadota bacterium]